MNKDLIEKFVEICQALGEAAVSGSGKEFCNDVESFLIWDNETSGEEYLLFCLGRACERAHEF